MSDDPEKRAKIACEILSTEETFVKHLKDVIEGYIAPLRSSAMVSPASISAIFSNLEMLCKLHAEFLNDLKSRIGAWSETTILGDVFISMAPYFKMHNQYIMNYENATSTLQKEKKASPAFAKFLADMQVSERFAGTHLNTLLIMPIQIIPRYELLLGQLIKNTKDSHKDYPQLCASLAKIKEINDFVNESCIKADKIQKMTAISLELGMEQLLTPTRKLLLECPMEMVSKIYTGPSMFYLFNDLVVMKTRKSSKHKPYISSDIVLTFIRAVTDKTCQFITKHRTVLLTFPDEAGFNSWKKAYEDAIQKQLDDSPNLKLERSSIIILENDGIFAAASSRDRKKTSKQVKTASLTRVHAVSLTHTPTTSSLKSGSLNALSSTSGVLFGGTSALSDNEEGEFSSDDEGDA